MSCWGRATFSITLAEEGLKESCDGTSYGERAEVRRRVGLAACWRYFWVVWPSALPLWSPTNIAGVNEKVITPNTNPSPKFAFPQVRGRCGKEVGCLVVPERGIDMVGVGGERTYAFHLALPYIDPLPSPPLLIVTFFSMPLSISTTAA